jgi:hypothetical protein
VAFKNKTPAAAARRKLMAAAASDGISAVDLGRGPCPNNQQVGQTQTQYFAGRPRTLWSHAAKGRLLYLPRTEMIVCPFQMTSSQDWNCLIVRGNQTYPRGGYEVLIFRDEIETAVIIDPERLGELTEGNPK